MQSYDYKKKFKELYMSGEAPCVTEVPEMTFIQIDGGGDPNVPDGEYKKALDALYSLSYTIKMMPKGGYTPKDYFEYVVPPLEGLWWTEDNSELDYSDKSGFRWISMIRQPEFVTGEVFAAACERVAAKKPDKDISGARLVRFTEGTCVQCLHIGSYDNEPETIRRMADFMAENSISCDINDVRRHHEIYLSDPRKCAAERLRTIIRHPVKMV